MQRRMSLEQYRTMDICVFTSILCVCEALIVLAGTRWFPGELYTLSLSGAVTALVIVRWGAWAAIPAVFGAVSFCLASGATAVQIAIYCIGNLAALLLCPWVRRVTWQRLHDNVLLTMGYGMAAALLMQTGRALVALVLGHAPSAMIMFYTTDVLSTLFSVLIVWICRRLDGMLEEQTHYIQRIQEEMDRAGGMDV